MTTQRFLIQILCLAAIGLSTFYCSTAKLASPEEGQRLRTMAAPPDKALVYIVRPAIGGAAIGMNLTCDGIHIGSTNGKRYIYALVSPGKHEFVSHAENKDELAIVAEAGKTYFIEQRVVIGILMPRSRLKRMDDAKGRGKLAKCKLSGDCPAYLAQRLQTSGK